MYTSGARLVRHYIDGNQYTAGTKAMTINCSNFSGLAKGTYFYVIEATDTGGKKAISKIDKIIILW